MIKLEKDTISILGCGWYGLALANELIATGYRIKGSTTSAHKLPLLRQAGIEPYLINLESDLSQIEKSFFDSDALIISIPPKRNSSDYVDQINAIALLAEQRDLKQVILISSTGVYQDGNAVVNEDTLPLPESHSGKIILAAENILLKRSFTTTIIRFAGLIGPGRNLAKHFAGKVAIANGLAPVNLIHLADCLGLSQTIIEQKAFGHIYHGVSPDHPTRKEFYTRICLASGLVKPEFKDELVAWKQIDSANVPRILSYTYQIDHWNIYDGVED